MRMILLTLFFFVSLCTFAQGKYAGPLLKKMIGKTYTDSKKVPGLASYQFREGSLVSDLKDPEKMIVEVLQKGTTAVVFFSLMTDTVKKIYSILDILEIKNVTKGWQVRTTFCRQDAIGNVEIVALVKQSPDKDYLTEVKQAWRFDRDKIRFLAIPVKGVDCFNEGGD